MKRLPSALILWLVAAVAVPFAISYATTRGISVTAKKGGESLYLYKDYYALVVGVGKYTAGWPDLPGASRDCEEVASALRDFGFTVKTIMNPTSKQLKGALAELAFRTGNEENRAVMFYFAGHGETLALADGTKLGYIIPSDCPLKNIDPIAFDDLAVSMKDIEALALKVRSKHLLILFDSCFSGSLFNLVRAAPVEISEKSALPVRQFITAGAEGEQVPDQSVFKQVFLDGIRSDADLNKDGYVTGSELGMYLQGKVVNYSRGGQHPQYGKINNPKLDKGDFIFVPLKTQQKTEAEEKGREQEKAAISEELKRLQEERKKSEELLAEMKRLMETRMRSDELEKKALAEQRDLEQKMKRAAEEQQTAKSRADEKVKIMEAERKASEEKLRKEMEERKALEEQLKKITAEREKALNAVMEMQSRQTQDSRVASVPKEQVKPSAQRPRDLNAGLRVAVFPLYFDEQKA